MSEIHALGAAVSMATSGAKSVKGGNWQIFAGMLKNASATVVLGTEVSYVPHDLCVSAPSLGSDLSAADG